MLLSALCVWCCLLYLVHAEYDYDVETACPVDFRYADTNRTINITESCNEKACIAMCCPGNQSLFWNQKTGNTSCDDNSNLTLAYNLTDLDEYPELNIYNNNVEREITKTATNIKQFIRIYSDNFLYTNSCTNYDLEVLFPPPTYLHYLLENGSLVIRRINHFYQWLIEVPPGQFCVEHKIILSKDGNISTQLVIRFTENVFSEDELSQRNTLSAYGMLVSCVFLLLVLAVYALLPELRNLAGVMLIAYVTTLTTAFLSRAVQVLSFDNNLLDVNACVYIGFIQYYSVLASFTWMNVMSFDIWWTMRGFRKLRQTHRPLLVKLGWYGLYGWGTPMLPVAFMIIVENIDMTHLPDFVTPHYSGPYSCFMEEGERLLYMNGPILIATCINITLFLMTAYNIWRIRRGVSQHSARDSRTNKKDETRFGIYLKLSLVMGINWILEVGGSLYKASSLWWYAPDMFNSLVGLFIFIIFVCKKKIVVLLCKRFSIGNELVLRLQSVDSARTESMRLNEKKSPNNRY